MCYIELVIYTNTRIKGIKVHYNVLGGKKVIMEHISTVVKKGEILKEEVLRINSDDYITEAYCSFVE